jgi:cytochrome c-type biogenesis protein CcmH
MIHGRGRRALKLAMPLALGLLVLLLVPLSAGADSLDDAVRRVALQLQCPVCEGESVADSPSGLATDMRALIRTRLSAGVPDQQILDEFVASYGDSILTDPPKRGVSLGVWIGPVLAILLGAALLVTLLRTWYRGHSGTPGTPPEVDADAVDEFNRFRQELSR